TLGAMAFTDPLSILTDAEMPISGLSFYASLNQAHTGQNSFTFQTHYDIPSTTTLPGQSTTLTVNGQTVIDSSLNIAGKLAGPIFPGATAGGANATFSAGGSAGGGGTSSSATVGIAVDPPSTVFSTYTGSNISTTGGVNLNQTVATGTVYSSGPPAS